MKWNLKKLFWGTAGSRHPGNDTTEPDPAAHEPSVDEWLRRGAAHASRQQWQSALDCFLEVTRVDPEHAAALAYSGNVLRVLGKPDAALTAYDRAIAVKRDYAEVHYNRGALLNEIGRPRTALESFDAALAISQSFAQAHNGRGDALRDLGRLDEALASYDAAIAIQPDNPRLHGARGVALMDLEHLDAAIASFDRAIQLNPGFARVFSNRARAQAKLGHRAAARASHDAAVALDPHDAAIHFNRGVFLSDCEDWEDAIDSYRAAISLKPDHAEAYCNLGLVQQETGQMDAALDSYSQALALNPKLVAAFNNRGNVFRSIKKFTSAMSDYRQAISLEPDSADAHYNIGQLALLQGNFAEGWPEYEYRHSTKEAWSVPPRILPQPSWRGEDSLAGRGIFLHAEQGLGDTIQFCRYASLVASRGAKVVLEVQASLGELFAQLDGVSNLILAGEPIPPADYQCSLMSLPNALRTTLDTIPSRVPYLRADLSKVARWRDILGPRTRPRIGLVWSGNPRNPNDHDRSVPLARWITHLPDQFEYIGLQSEIRDADRQTLLSYGKIKVFDANLAETAALIETLDLVLSVDTSIAHLSGALGKETWILLPFLPDWRWLLDRRDSPWYPTATLYRQAGRGDWESVFAAINHDLFLRFR